MLVIPNRADGEGPHRRSNATATNVAGSADDARCYPCATTSIGRSLAVSAARDDNVVRAGFGFGRYLKIDTGLPTVTISLTRAASQLAVRMHP